MSPDLLSGFDFTRDFPSGNGAMEEFTSNIASMGTGNADDSINSTLLAGASLVPSRNDSGQLEPQGQLRLYPDGGFQAQPDPPMPGPQTASEPLSAPAALTRQLAELLISLEEHASLIPPLSIHRLSSEQQPSGPYFSLDRTFHLTQTLIDLYLQLTKTIIHREPTDIRRPPSGSLSSFEPFLNPNDLSSPQLSQEHALKPPSSFDGASRTTNVTPVVTSDPRPHQNHASILLILSCHHRLIDMWESIFSHIPAIPAHVFGQHCLKFKIGSFVPSTPSSAVPMEIIMVVELATQLLERIRELVDELEGPVPTSTQKGTVAEDSPKSISGQGPEGRRSADGDATVMTGKVVLNRARSMVEEIGRIRDDMQERRRELAKAAP